MADNSDKFMNLPIEKKWFTLYRDLDSKTTHVIEHITSDLIRDFETDDFKYGVTIVYPGDHVKKIPVKEYLEKDEPFAKFLKANKKELLHKEIILNEDNKPIDRSLAHMIGDRKIDSLSYVQSGVHVWATVDIKGVRYALFYKRKGANYYQNCVAGGHSSAEDKDILTSVIREVEEEIGVKTKDWDLSFLCELKLEEIIRGSKINCEKNSVYHIHLQENDLENIKAEEEEISEHILVPVNMLNNFSEDKPIPVNIRVINGKVENIDLSLKLSDMNPELTSINKNHFETQYNFLRTN